jgi:hypothetical protein
MNCRTNHQDDERDHQPFPRSGRLAVNANLPPETLRQRVAGTGTVYCYIITSVKNRDGQLVQAGCGPNFQGDLITLCTCKHFMRTFLDAGDWEGQWIAGFTTSATGEGKNFLVYLMRVSQAYQSHRDLWLSSRISQRTKQAKAVHLDKFGDLYQPQTGIIAPWDPRGYISPRSNHRHAQDWKGDVAYEGVGGRPAALLVGDPSYSFLWNHPEVYCPDRLHRGQKKSSLAKLLDQLKTREIS